MGLRIAEKRRVTCIDTKPINLDSETWITDTTQCINPERKIDLVWESLALSAVKELLSLLKSEAQLYIASLKERRTNSLSAKIKKAQIEAENTEDDQERSVRYEGVKRLQNTLQRLSEFPEGAIEIDEARSIEKLREHHAAIHAWAQFVHFRDMGPKRTLGDSYIPLSVYLIPRRKHVETNEAENLSDADSVLRDSRSNTLILGGAGAGKTTTLKNYVKSLWPIEKDTKEREADLWPILVRFRDEDFSQESKSHLARMLMGLLCISVSGVNKLGKEKDEAAFIDELYEEIGSKIYSFLNKISATVMLDGFDEVNSTQAKGRIIEEINRATHCAPNIRFILTCRTGELRAPPRGFDEYEIAPLSAEQIDRFLRKWVVGADKIAKIKSEMLDKGYFDTAVRPINLAYICAIFLRTGGVPRRPRDLLSRIADMLVYEWDESRFVQRGDHSDDFNNIRKRDMLKRIAYYCSFETGNPSLSEKDLKKLSTIFEKRFQIKESSFHELAAQLEAHTGIFIQSGMSTYEFSHKTIQEFLAAEYLVALGYIPEDIEPGKQVAAELAMACAQSSNADSYAVKLCKGHFLKHESNLDITLPFFRRLIVEEVKFDGEQFGLGLVFFLYTLAALPGIHRSVSLNSRPASETFSGCFRDLPLSARMIEALLLDSVEKSAETFRRQAKLIHEDCSEHFDIFEWRAEQRLDLGTFPAVFVPKNVSKSLSLVD